MKTEDKKRGMIRYGLLLWLFGMGGGVILTALSEAWSTMWAFLIFSCAALAFQPVKSRYPAHYSMGLTTWIAPWFAATIFLLTLPTSLTSKGWPVFHGALLFLVFCQIPFVGWNILVNPEEKFWGGD